MWVDCQAPSCGKLSVDDNFNKWRSSVGASQGHSALHRFIQTASSKALKWEGWSVWDDMLQRDSILPDCCIRPPCLGKGGGSIRAVFFIRMGWMHKPGRVTWAGCCMWG